MEKLGGRDQEWNPLPARGPITWPTRDRRHCRSDAALSIIAPNCRRPCIETDMNDQIRAPYTPTSTPSYPGEATSSTQRPHTHRNTRTADTIAAQPTLPHRRISATFLFWIYDVERAAPGFPSRERAQISRSPRPDKKKPRTFWRTKNRGHWNILVERNCSRLWKNRTYLASARMTGWMHTVPRRQD